MLFYFGRLVIVLCQKLRLQFVLAVAVAFAAAIGLTACKAAQPPFKFAERGVNVYVSTDKFKNDAPQAITARANDVFDYAVELHANAVALFIPIFTDGPSGSVVSRQVKTPSDVMLSLVVRSAHEHHLRVMFRPAIDQNNLEPSGHWRGDIQPANRNLWFATYLQTLRPFVRLAADLQVEAFQVGVELDSLEGDPRWQTVVQVVRAGYHGEVSYSVHWQPFARGSAVSPTENYGVTAYPSFSLADDATYDQVLAAWDGWLDAVATTHDMAKIGFDEVGIASSPGMYRQPYTYDLPGMAYDPHVQSVWFAAACEAARRHHVPWLYFWKIDFHKDPAAADPASDPPTSFLARPGEAAIRACFAAG